MLEVFGVIVGLVYLWLEYKASIYLWIASVVMPAIYIFVYYDAGLYADFGINIYYLVIALYGWWLWKRGVRSDSSEMLPPSFMAGRYIVPLTLSFLILFLFIAWILIRFTDSTVPWLDSFTTSLSIVAMWMLARKYVEQWWVWIVVDVVSAGLYVYKDLHFTAALYGLYAVVAYFGYLKWKKMALEGGDIEKSISIDKWEECEAVILADGNYPEVPEPLSLLSRVACVACCDGAADAYLSKGKVPHAIVGDGDSLSVESRKRYSDIFHIVSDQETNDLTKTFNFLFNQGKRCIALLGATGRREDHTLANISLLIEYMHRGAHVRMYTDYGLFIPCNGTSVFSSFPGQQVSIFNFGSREMHADGLRYPLFDFGNWWQGTLNESVDNQFTISAKGDYLVFLTYKKK